MRKPTYVDVTGSAAEDGMYSYSGTLDEVDADPSDKDEFMRQAAIVAMEQAFAPMRIDVDEKLGTFTFTFINRYHKHGEE